ncbi:MAG: tRNA uridine-5-carboxymethylaminomethyl(34) synthesis GTPase MnmE, partial [Prevotella sp.]|nr:tRNA uridine-5-carboxymethylaminomethyl(34) synthesis GTPase MnmE [Prevotella sp.]
MNDTITAICTPPGQGAISIIRLSGNNAFEILQKGWKGKPIHKIQSHTAHLGEIISPDGKTLDQALITIFREPYSFTGENVAEIAIHGSTYIQNAVIDAMIKYGAKPAGPGEFSKRAFLNHKIDLAQAEGIADLIAAESRAAHRLAISQATGKFSRHINNLRENLIQLASLIELELDFSEEDVTFADRNNLLQLTSQGIKTVDALINSFEDGNAFKNGIPVAIIGQPNAGKSSLLNTLLNDDKAIVTDIPGTTRDTIEDTTQIDGILFRFIDTAGIRHTTDTIEQIGIERSINAIKKATIILHLTPKDSITQTDPESPIKNALSNLTPQQTLIQITSKADLPNNTTTTNNSTQQPTLEISAKTGQNIDTLKKLLLKTATKEHNPDTDIIITNRRHLQTLQQASNSLHLTEESLRQGRSSDLIAEDLRQAIHHLSELTGDIPPTLLLHRIFSTFCIGK